MKKTLLKLKVSKEQIILSLIGLIIAYMVIMFVLGQMGILHLSNLPK